MDFTFLLYIPITNSQDKLKLRELGLTHWQRSMLKTYTQESVLNFNAILYHFRSEKLAEDMNQAHKCFKHILHKPFWKDNKIFHSLKYRKNVPTEKSGCEVSCTLTWSKPWNTTEYTSMSGTLVRCQHVTISYQSQLYNKIKCYSVHTSSSHSSIKTLFIETAINKVSSFIPQSFLHFPNDCQKHLSNQYIAKKLFTNHNTT